LAKISNKIGFHKNSFTSLTLLLATIIANIQCNIHYNYLRYLKNYFVSKEHDNFFQVI